MPALLFGSIGTLADTSELQRAAFNEAFREHGLDWEWGQDEYRQLLTESGGEQRVAAYAQARGEDVDAAAVHATKSAIYQRKLTAQPVQPRSGVPETIAQAKEKGVKLALVTTTARENLDALAQSLSSSVDFGQFDLIVDRSAVDQPKPAPDVYLHALERLGESKDRAVAIEDNAGGLQAATAGGLTVIAFPGQNNAGHDFAGAQRTVDHLDPDALLTIADGPEAA